MKSDFITNSSSTAYIVLIPNDYRLSAEAFYQTYNSKKEHYDEAIDATMEECEAIIELLKEGENVYANGDFHHNDSLLGGVSNFIWEIILDIFCDDNLLLNSLDTSSDTPNIIIGVTQEKTQEILLNHINLQKILKTCNERGTKSANETQTK